VLAALALLAALQGCATVPGPEEVASLRIARREGAGDGWSEERALAAAPAELGPDRLAQALRFCTQKDPVKFAPRFRVTLVGRDGRETAFLVLGRLVKVHGISYRCDEDVEAIAARRWSGRLGP
jgi:hypothetical protein